MVTTKQIIIVIVSFLIGTAVGTASVLWYIQSQEFSPTDYLENTREQDQSGADEILDEIIGEAISTDHNAARDEEWYYQRLDLICRSYADLCDIVSLAGNFDREDAFFYKAIAVFVIARIDRYYTDGSLRDIIKTLKVTDNDGRRGSAGRDRATINTADMINYKEYLEIIVHELGHVVDLGLIQGNSNVYHTNFTEFGRKVFGLDDPSLFFYQLTRDSERIRKANVDKYDFCSGYGQTNPFEDFSECFNLYMDHNALFRSLAMDNNILRQKYNILAEFFGGKYLYDNASDLTLLTTDKKFFVFDTTKIGR